MKRWTPRDLAWLGIPTETRLGLTVVGYENPGHAKPGDTDSNWLLIGGRVECERGGWSFQDPCLTTWELASLITWLGEFPNPDEIDFLEPLLAFATNDTTHITVNLRAEALPDGLGDDETRWHKGVPLELRVTAKSVADFADRLKRLLEQYPAR